MNSPTKITALQRDSHFIIRKTLRPPSALRPSLHLSPSHLLSPQKTKRQTRKNYYESSPTRNIGPSSLGLSTTCWCLYDSRMHIEVGFRQNHQREIASLTKIMTTLLSIEAIQRYAIRLNLLVRITEAAAKMTGTTANLKAGTWVTLQNLLFGTMLPSGNDAAFTLAEVVGYFIIAQQKCDSVDVLSHLQTIDLTEENTGNYVSEFIKRMNSKAEELELANTRFSNPHGLQNALNISTAKDMLILSMHASRNTTFRQIMNAEYRRYQNYSDEYKSSREVRVWQNTNCLLSKGWEGVKTGITATAGACLASLRNGVFIVVLNCSDADRRFTETEKLYSWYSDSQRREVRMSLESPQRCFQ